MYVIKAEEINEEKHTTKKWLIFVDSSKKKSITSSSANLGANILRKKAETEMISVKVNSSMHT